MYKNETKINGHKIAYLRHNIFNYKKKLIKNSEIVSKIENKINQQRQSSNILKNTYQELQESLKFCQNTNSIKSSIAWYHKAYELSFKCNQILENLKIEAKPLISERAEILNNLKKLEKSFLDQKIKISRNLANQNNFMDEQELFEKVADI